MYENLMTIEFNAAALIREGQLQMADRMLRAAVFFQTAHKQMLNVPNTGVRMRRKRDRTLKDGTFLKKGSGYTIYPDPSKPGEYSRKITGQGQSGVVYGPETKEDVVDRNDMAVMIGHRAFMGGEEFRRGKSAEGGGFNYIIHHEMKMQRLGYRKTAETIRPQITAIVQGVQ